jgi:hypothetical protein
VNEFGLPASNKSQADAFSAVKTALAELGRKDLTMLTKVNHSCKITLKVSARCLRFGSGP